jgi:thiamine pyrophosphokinase
VHVPNQAFSDFQKSIHYIKINDLFPSIILGISGGYLDHILNNINIFLQTDSIFFAPPIVGHIINSENIKTFSLPVNTKISFIGVPTANVTTTGLKWELQDNLLSFFGTNSCFNRVATDQVTITVRNGAILALIYLRDINDAGK